MAAKAKTPTKKKEPKHPDRDEFDLEEIANTLIEAMDGNQIKIFTIYKWEEPLTGTIKKWMQTLN